MGIHRKIRTRRAKIKKVNFLASPREGVRRGNFSRVPLLYIISTLITRLRLLRLRRSPLARSPQPELTLPLVNPPIEPGPLSNLFWPFSRSRASRAGAEAHVRHTSARKVFRASSPRMQDKAT